MATRSPLYDSDFYAWSREQADLLRAGKLAQADIDNIAEEIESMGARKSASSSVGLRSSCFICLNGDTSRKSAARAGKRASASSGTASKTTLTTTRA